MRADDKLRAALTLKVHNVLTDFVGKQNTGRTQEQIEAAVAEALSEKRRALATSIVDTDEGPVLMLDMRSFVGQSAQDLRALGIAVPSKIPDNATIRLDEIGKAIYEWVEISANIPRSQ